MSIRQSCVEERPAMTADERQHSFNSISLARAARQSQTKPDKSGTSRPTFKEDFLFEHSPSGQQLDSIKFAGYF